MTERNTTSSKIMKENEKETFGKKSNLKAGENEN